MKIDGGQERQERLHSHSTAKKFQCETIHQICCIYASVFISKLISQLVDWVIIQGKEEKLISEMKLHKNTLHVRIYVDA